MKCSTPSKAALEKAKAAAQAKRASIGLEPVAPENVEYEAQEAARRLPARMRITRASTVNSDGEVRTWEGDVLVEAGQDIAIDVSKMERKR